MKFQLFAKAFFAILLLGSLESRVLGQAEAPEVIPPAPNSAAISSFDLVPTNGYTGRQNFSVPLHSISFDGAQIPITLSYSGGGVRASQEAGYMGLSWGLSFGGSISRTIKGYNDFGSNGYLNDTQPIPKYIDVPNDIVSFDAGDSSHYPSSTYWTSYIQGGKRDTEPDEFSYTFMGYSGSFVFQKKENSGDQAEVFKITGDATKIEYNELTQTFTITTPDGFKGAFSVHEWTTSFSGSEANGLLTGCNLNNVDVFAVFGNGYGNSKRVITSWYPNQITSPNGRTLNYEYYLNSNGNSNYMSKTAFSYSESKSFNSIFSAQDEYSKNCSYRVVEEIYPKRITSDYGNVDISFTLASRSDIGQMTDYLSFYEVPRGESTVTSSPPQRISSIQVGNSSSLSSLNKSIIFGHDYFNNTEGVNKKRLRLDAVTIDDQQYTFEYENGFAGLPDKSTFGIDYWGYYNGKDNNLSILPVTIGYSSVANFYGPQLTRYTPNDLFYYQTDDRKANFDYGKAGLLTKVNYPTGGSVKFDYESHEYKLEGQEVIPVQGDIVKNTNISTSPITTTYSTSASPYEGFIMSGGTCVYQIELFYRLSCHYTSYPGNLPCTPLDVNDFDVAVQIINANTNDVARAIYFQELELHLQSTSNSYTISKTINVQLGPGSYYLKAFRKPGYTAYARMSYPKSCDGVSQDIVVSETNNQFAGGARIAAVTNFDSDGSFVQRKRYEYQDFGIGPKSSGYLLNPLMNFGFYGSSPVNGNNAYVFTSSTIVGNSGAAQGSHIGYKYVREILEDSLGNDLGRTSIIYSNNPNIISNYGTVGVVNTEPLNGLIESQLITNATGQTEQLLENNDNIEEIDYVRAMKLDYVGGSPGAVLLSGYKIKSYFTQPKETVTTQYLDGGSLETTTNRTFNNNYLLKSETMTDSYGDVIQTSYYRSSDYGNSAGVVSAMKSNHYVSPVIQQVQSVNGTIQSASSTLFKPVGSNYLPEKVLVQNNDLGGFSLSPNGISFGASQEERITFNLYDAYGNIREYTNEAGVKTTVLWGYNSTYPVAQIQNASYSQVSGLINQTLIDDPSNQQTLEAALNALRDHPTMKNALVTTMTYEPGVGLLSQTAPNGLKTSYEYDNYSRLSLIRDHNGHILRKTEYAYKVSANNTAY